jgi:mono/diheme cytochrome c family protein
VIFDLCLRHAFCSSATRERTRRPLFARGKEGKGDLKRPSHSTRSVITLGALLLAFASGACGGNSATAPTAQTPPAPTFSTIQTQIFDAACVTCHTDVGRTPAGGLNLKAGSAHPGLVNVASTGQPGAVRVIPGNPGGSYLVQKLEGAPGIAGLRMPRNGPPFLTDAQVKTIRDWIAAGALNN